jgi:hypothetical protein
MIFLFYPLNLIIITSRLFVEAFNFSITLSSLIAFFNLEEILLLLKHTYLLVGRQFSFIAKYELSSI